MSTIVVGVDGSPQAGEALRFALEEARLRDARLVAVHAWRMPLAESPGPFLLELPVRERPVEEVAAAYAQAAGALLAEAVAAVTEARAGVDVEQRLVEGPAAAALIDASAGADLLVVGTRGRGGFARLLLGSVSQQCAAHARCPVILVPRRAG